MQLDNADDYSSRNLQLNNAEGLTSSAASPGEGITSLIWLDRFDGSQLGGRNLLSGLVGIGPYGEVHGRELWSYATIPVGEPAFIGAYYRSNDIQRLYINGATETYSTEGYAVNLSANVRIGSYGVEGTPHVHVNQVAVFDGLLTAAEIESLRLDRYQLFAPQRIWVPVPAGGGGGGTTYPMTLTASVSAVGAARKAAAAALVSSTITAAAAHRAVSAARSAAAAVTAPPPVKDVEATRSSGSAVMATAMRALGMSRAAAADVTASARHGIAMTLGAGAAALASASTIKAKLLTLAASVGALAGVQRAASLSRSAVAASSAAARRAAALTLLAAAGAGAAIGKAAALRRAAAAAATGVLTASRLRLLVLLASVGASAHLVAQLAAAPPVQAVLRVVRTILRSRVVRTRFIAPRKVTSMGTAEAVADIFATDAGVKVQFDFTAEMQPAAATIPNLDALAWGVEVRSGFDANPDALWDGAPSLDATQRIVTRRVKGQRAPVAYALRCVATGSDGEKRTAVALLDVL